MVRGLGDEVGAPLKARFIALQQSLAALGYVLCTDASRPAIPTNPFHSRTPMPGIYTHTRQHTQQSHVCWARAPRLLGMMMAFGVNAPCGAVRISYAAAAAAVAACVHARLFALYAHV